MSDGLAIGGVSVGLGDARNIDSQISIPKNDNFDLQSLPNSFYSAESSSLDYSSPMINEFSGLGDLSISSDISLKGVGASEFNFVLPELSGAGVFDNKEAEEILAFQAMGGATPPGFEGQGASYRPEHLRPVNQIEQLAQKFADL